MATKGLRERFETQAPSEEVAGEMRRWRADFAAFADMIDEVAPDSREKSLAFTHLEEALFWTNKAIILADNAASRLPRPPQETPHARSIVDEDTHPMNGAPE
jgi:hypothetical protein